MSRFWADSDQVFGRRKIFKGLAGAAAVGAGGVLLVDAAAPASAAPLNATVESGAVAPAVVALTDAATIAVDASLGNDFRVTIAGNRTMGTPANPADGQKITFQVTQGTGGSVHAHLGQRLRVLGRPAAAHPQHDRRGRPTCSASSTTRPRAHGCLPPSWPGSHPGSGPPPTPTPTPRRPTPTPTTTPTAPTGTYRLFPSTSGPATAVSYSGPFVAGGRRAGSPRRLLAGRLLVVGVRGPASRRRRRSSRCGRCTTASSGSACR